MNLCKGMPVNTPNGKGKVAYIRFRAPEYSALEAVGVVLDNRNDDPTYTSTCYPAEDIWIGV